MNRKELNLALIENSRSLRLSYIMEYFKEKNELSQETCLELNQLFESELELRSTRRIDRLLRASQLPLQKTKESFDLKRLPLKLRKRVDALLDGEFLNRRENVLAFGNPGSGKTHLCCAIAQELIHQGHSVYFSSTNMLVQELLLAKRELYLPKMLKRLSKYEMLVLDDIGYVQQTAEEIEVLFTLFAERYERGSIMLTSNLPFSKWDQIFKDPMTTAAAIDRVIPPKNGGLYK